MQRTMLALALLSMWTLSCISSKLDLQTHPYPEQTELTQLVVQDKTGTIVVHTTIPGRVSDHLREILWNRDLMIIQKFKRNSHRMIQKALDAARLQAGREPIRLKKALAQKLVTCHKAFYDGTLFAGIGTSDCHDALLVRGDPNVPPVLMGQSNSPYAGLTPEAIALEQSNGTSEALLPQCVNMNPKSISWEEIYPFLKAYIVLKRSEDGVSKIYYCTGINNLGGIPEAERDSDLSQAARLALIRLRAEESPTKGPSEVLLLQYLREDYEHFPENFLNNEEVRVMLHPLLAQELGSCNVTLMESMR